MSKLWVGLSGLNREQGFDLIEIVQSDSDVMEAIHIVIVMNKEIEVCVGLLKADLKKTRPSVGFSVLTQNLYQSSFKKRETFLKAFFVFLHKKLIVL